MNSSIFKFEETVIRTDIDDNGEPLFCASDVAQCLGYERPNDAVSAHCRDTVKRRTIDSIGRSQEANFISEGDLYRLILRSKLPTAQRFEAWVVNEVLPSIRKTGVYSVPGAQRPALDDDWRRMREARLSRAQSAKGLERALQLAETTCPNDAIIYRVKIAETLAGQRFPELLPKTSTASWKSAEEIAKECGVSSHKIGLVVSSLWGRVRCEIPGVMQARITKALHCEKQVPQWFYSTQAVEQIRARLNETETDTNGSDTDDGAAARTLN